MLRAIIADDEELGVQMLKVLLNEAQDSIGLIDIVKTCGTGEDTLKAIDDLSPDIVFLDIHMPAGDGMLVAEALFKAKAALPHIIFITAHAEHAARAFDVEAVDYLLKPVQLGRLQRAIQRVLDIRSAPATETPRMIPVPVFGGIEMIDAASIEWAEASGDYIELHTANRAIMVRRTLSSFASDMAPMLTRTHRSYLVNLDFIQKIVPMAKGEAVLLTRSGAEIPVSRSYKSVLTDLRQLTRWIEP